MDESSGKKSELTVLYDGACPLCIREIGVYKNCQPLESRLSICFKDVNDTYASLPNGISREALLSRFHVQGQDGELVSGAKAFLTLWSALPGWRWLAYLGQLPGMTWVMEQTYLIFLRFRPTLQKWVIRIDQRYP